MANRPFLITLIAILAILLGLVSLFSGLILVLADVVPDGVSQSLEAIHTLGYVTLIVGIISIIVGFALWKGWTIAWYLGLILFGINAIMGIINIVTGNYASVLSLIIALIVIWYLFRPGVKSFFKV